MRLLVDEPIGAGLVGDRADQARIEVGAHGLQDDADVQTPERPSGVKEAGRLDAELAQHEDADQQRRAHHQDPARHERQAQLQQ